MLRTLLCVAASPVIALAVVAIGLLAALAHLIAMPALYLWERRLERFPLGGAGEIAPCTSSEIAQVKPGDCSVLDPMESKNPGR